MRVDVFGKEECAKCRTTKNKLNHFLKKWGLDGKVEIQYFDMDSEEGIAEGAFRDVGQIPTIIVEDGGKDLARWEGVVPDSDEVKSALTGQA